MLETIPNPVTTTRRMQFLFAVRLFLTRAATPGGGYPEVVFPAPRPIRPSAPAWRSGLDRLRLALEQADLQILGFVDRLAIGLHDAVGDAEHQLAHAHALQVQVIA